MITSTEIKEWLKASKKTHAWLADKIFASPNTVNGWLSSGKPIPKRRAEQISRLMLQYSPTTGITPSADDNTLTLSVDSDTFDTWNTAATRENKLLRQWAIDVLTAHARQTQKDQ